MLGRAFRPIVPVVLLSFVSAAGAGVTTCVSVASNGQYCNDDSYTASISATGRYVAFCSDANNLVPGDTNNLPDVFLHDRVTGRTTRVSVASDGSQGTGTSWEPSASGTGQLIAFSSSAANLVPGDTNGYQDVFIHNRQTGQTGRVSVATGGGQSNESSRAPSVSREGGFVAFLSYASNLVPGDTNGRYDVFVHELATGQTTIASLSSGGSQGNNDCDFPSISGDGRYVAFQSGADNFVTGDTNEAQDIFVRDRLTGQTTRVSVASGGAEGNANSQYPTISANGRYVGFESYASNLVAGDTNGQVDVFVHDRLTGQTTRVSVASDGTQGNGVSGDRVAMNTTGRYVAYRSGASNLVAGDTNNWWDVFLHDRDTGQTTRVSVATDGSQGIMTSSYPSMSGDGRLVTFETWSFASGAYNKVFVHDRLAGVLPDMWIKKADSWVGDDIYNITGQGQTERRVVDPGSVATYRLKIQNDGSDPGQFIVEGTAGTADWEVHYYDRTVGGSDITAAITGSGFQTPVIQPGAFLIGRLEVTPLSGAAGTTYTVAVSASPVGAPKTEDVVKARTTARQVQTAPQMVSLAAVSTPRGAEVIVSLSAPATVTATVRSIAGRPIRAICREMECEAGTNTLVWNARSDSGLSVPNGTYMVEVAARNADGQQAKALGTVSIRR